MTEIVDKTTAALEQLLERRDVAEVVAYDLCELADFDINELDVDQQLWYVLAVINIEGLEDAHDVARSILR